MGALCCCCLQPQVAEKRDPNDPESFLPSSLSLRSSTPTIKNFSEITVETPYAGGKKILVICTTKYLLEMANGKYFNTGHQASETLLPIYHLGKCGFEFEFATPDGGKVALEEWTFPMAVGYDDKLRAVQEKYAAQLKAPTPLADIPDDLEPYAALFLPGGHGPVIEQGKIARIGELLRSAHAKSLPTISLCHGPAALLSGTIGGEFPYSGYKLCVFPDAMDLQTPKFGYLPGYIKEEDKLEQNLVKLGMIVQNKEMDDSTCVDRELVTGASQMASQTLAFAAAKFLAEKYDFKIKI